MECQRLEVKNVAHARVAQRCAVAGPSGRRPLGTIGALVYNLVVHQSVQAIGQVSVELFRGGPYGVPNGVMMRVRPLSEVELCLYLALAYLLALARPYASLSSARSA